MKRVSIYPPLFRRIRLRRDKYSCAKLREIRAVKGVGRPPCR